MTDDRLTAIDNGSNSIRSRVVESGSSGKFRVLDDEKATVRLADGLDRSRTGMVTIAEPILSPSRFVLRLRGSGDLSVEIFGATSKSDLFCAAFDLELVLEPVDDPSQVLT